MSNGRLIVYFNIPSCYYRVSKKPTRKTKVDKQTAAKQTNLISYPVRSEINQIEPRLDIFWQDQLAAVFAALTSEERAQVTAQLLAPKEIFWDETSGKFVYRPAEASGGLTDGIQSMPQHLAALLRFLQDILFTLKELEDAGKIAELLENALDKIQAVQTDNKPDWQRAKQRLYSNFICAAAAVIRDKTDWVIPENRRNLNFPVIKTFINEVFLKQRLLGHLFRTLRNRQLAEMPHPLLNTFLREEQRVRQLEIVRASKYLFAIAPTVESGLNPFNLRRFLQEDALYSEDQFLLNGTAVNTALLANGDEGIQTRFKQQVAAIITIEGTVSRVIIDLMENLEKYHEDQLFPLLFQPLDANMALEKAIAARLQEYESLMEENIFQPFKAIVRRAANQDELNYLQVGMRQLFGSIISVFKDFQTLPAVRGSETADIFLGGLVAYAAFLEKRREDVFVRMDDDEWQSACLRAEQVAAEFKELGAESLPEYRRLGRQAEETAAKIKEHPSFFDKLFKRNEKNAEKLAETKQKMRKTASIVHDKLYRFANEHPQQIVNLELEALPTTSVGFHRYALPAGENGLTKLPLPIGLEESRAKFDLERFVRQFA